MKAMITIMTKTLTELRPAVVLLGILGMLTGLAYPILMQGVGRLAFPSKSEGSLLLQDGKPIGSKWIGQHFNSPRYFWSRPSATTPGSNNALASGGANMGPTNPALVEAVQARIVALKQDGHRRVKNAGKVKDTAAMPTIPVDLVTASASGLDPDISPAAAYYQVARVAKARSKPDALIRRLIEENTQGRQFGFLGEPRVNVLQLNLALDAWQKKTSEEK